MTDDASAPRTVHELRIAMTVQAYEEAVAFYRDALGLAEIESWDRPDGRGTILDAGHATLELFDPRMADSLDAIEVGRRVSGTIRFALEVDDSIAMADHLVLNGATREADVVVTAWRDQNARVKAPDGMQLTLFTHLDFGLTEVPTTKKGAKRMAAIRRPPIQAAYLEKPRHLQTVKERVEVGRALRVACPRESHADWSPPAHRKDPIDLLIASNEGRIEHLLPIRHGRMVVSQFAFYRGGPAIMAADLAETPATGYRVQACGDCHLLNFGAFATPERRIIFDINDFDETFPAPWEWDLKRLAASLVVASRANGHRPKDAREAARAAVLAYGDSAAELAGMKTLDAWYSSLDWEDVIAQTDDDVLRKRRAAVLDKAIRRDAAAEFTRLGHTVDGKPRIKDDPPLIYHPDEVDDPDFREVVTANFARYRESLPPDRRVLFDRYELADVAMKVVGVGSVGTLCAVGLFFAADGDALFLQVKQANTSVLEPYVGASPFASDGERVVFGQRLMQAASDVFLGHMVGVRRRHFYVRQLRDVKVRPMVELFTPANMSRYARNCGWALARDHARSGDPAILAGYIGGGRVFAGAIADFAVAYADQNEHDHAAMVEAVREGRLEAHFEE